MLPKTVDVAVTKIYTVNTTLIEFPHSLQSKQWTGEA